ncbi:MAG: hypothetical protein LC746_06260 [Acidobacteria bacterium]|nr:hypothetical protein [Acidobacteriota bacterium]
MPPPYDTVISIGGQSLVDGVWHLFGPALEELSNPLPLPLPGFGDAAMRITHVVPVIPGTAPGKLQVLATFEVTAEALLSVNLAAGGFSVTLGPQNLHLTNLTGTVGLPDQTGALTNILIGGNYPPPIGHVDLGPGTGSLDLPASTATLTGGDLTGTLDLPGSLALPTLPLPAVVPVAVNLTPGGGRAVAATVDLLAGGVNTATRFSLVVLTDAADVAPVTLDPALPAALTTTLQNAVDGIVAQLGVPGVISQTPVSAATVTALLAPVANAIRSALADALSRMIGETGRLAFPPADDSASCDARSLPAVGDAHLALAADGTYALQLGFARAGAGDIPSLPTSPPVGSEDVSLIVGNRFLLSLLCCLVERLPAFTLPVAATTSTTDVKGQPHILCCNFTGATADFNLIALGGGLSLCIDGTTDGAKEITLVGHFAQDTAVADITVDFTLPLAFDLDDAAALTNLRVAGQPSVTVDVSPNGWLLAFFIALGVVGGILGWLGSIFGSGSAIVVISAVAVVTLIVVCRMVGALLNNSVRTILREASLLSSPASVPPGVFDAFGKLVPASVSFDDLTARGVLRTPTDPWALLPRIGAGGRRPPKGGTTLE